MISDLDHCSVCGQRPRRLAIIEEAGDVWWIVRCCSDPRSVQVVIAAPAEPEVAPIPTAREIADQYDRQLPEHEKRLGLFGVVARLAGRVVALEER